MCDWGGERRALEGTQVLPGSLLATVRRITDKVPKEERDCCHMDGVDALMSSYHKSSHSGATVQKVVPHEGA